MQVLTQWQTDWALEAMPTEPTEVEVHELLEEMRHAPDSELYQLALTLLRESAENH